MVGIKDGSILHEDQEIPVEAADVEGIAPV